MTADPYGFLTSTADATAGATLAEAIPGMLTGAREWKACLAAPFHDARALRRRLPDNVLRIVAEAKTARGR